MRQSDRTDRMIWFAVTALLIMTIIVAAGVSFLPTRVPEAVWAAMQSAERVAASMGASERARLAEAARIRQSREQLASLPFEKRFANELDCFDEAGRGVVLTISNRMNAMFRGRKATIGFAKVQTANEVVLVFVAPGDRLEQGDEVTLFVYNLSNSQKIHFAKRADAPAASARRVIPERNREPCRHRFEAR